MHFKFLEKMLYILYLLVGLLYKNFLWVTTCFIILTNIFFTFFLSAKSNTFSHRNYVLSDVMEEIVYISQYLHRNLWPLNKQRYTPEFIGNLFLFLMNNHK